METSLLPPGWILILGALLIPLVPTRAKQALLLLLPAAGLYQLVFLLPDGAPSLSASIFGYALEIVRVDALARVWGTIFYIAAFLAALYSLRVEDDIQHVGALVYAGAAIGAVFAGDLITLFIYWELTAISSVFLVWASRSEQSLRSGMRYLVIQVASGVLLLAGVVLHIHETGSIAFTNLGGVSGLATLLIFLAMGIKAAFPLLHNWLQDAYPVSTVTGAVWLSTFTTKLAIYALARGFPGEDLLIPIGAVMTIFPIFYAVLENDLRRVLAYSLNNQLGFMVVGIGIGTAASINGAAAHAFAHILYKSLLFMSIGAVLLRTGTALGTELGGLYKSMPWTAFFCVIGAASISAFPLTSGFISKAIILTEAAEAHMVVVWLVLVFASAGVLHHAGIKVPNIAFFHRDAGIRVKEAPLNMLLAMGIAAALCIGIGVYPSALYELLPSQPVLYEPYTVAHVVTQMELLMFAALAFGVLAWHHIEPPEQRGVNLDFDWIYRRGAPVVLQRLGHVIRTVRGGIVGATYSQIQATLERLHRYHGPSGILAGTWPTGSMAIWTAVLLTTVLVLYFN